MCMKSFLPLTTKPTLTSGVLACENECFYCSRPKQTARLKLWVTFACRREPNNDIRCPRKELPPVEIGAQELQCCVLYVISCSCYHTWRNLQLRNSSDEALQDE